LNSRNLQIQKALRASRRRQRSGGSWFKATLGKQCLKTLSQKTLHKNRAGGVAQGEGPEFKPLFVVLQKKKKKKKGKKEKGKDKSLQE
jgi:hypothetical protein